MSLEDEFGKFFESFKPTFTENDKTKLRQSARRSTLQKWRWSYGIKAMSVGAVSGLIPSKDLGTAGTIMMADLSALLLLSMRASFGIGHIIDKNEVNYGDDIIGILAIWTQVGQPVEALAVVPVGKVALKLSAKSLPKVAAPLVGQLAYKGLSKTNSKVLAKLTSKVVAKMATKIGTKLAAKEGIKTFSQVAPLVGSAASLSINLWIINGIMDAAEKYYSGTILLVDDDLGGLAPA